jgi:translation initiation factor 2B subunit (eIF-2B alpha/beta/delta family)
MVFEDNEWKLSNIDNIPQIIDKVCIFSSEQINTLKNKHPNNKSLQDRLNIVEKYNNMIDNDFIEDLKDDTDNDNKKLIQRCEEFQKHTYNTFKKTLYNEGKKIKKNYKK